ncbi:MAG TPA: helix-turn-helix domain-containing GNAT family N-acetyltransferase [Candidatus Polarisedimenticolia bacterium]|nr:helix-turn-helix domain-containing GNAT family N-acetyltransferase [Candidatus Polarisedimenticolia bacterium]
MGRTPAARVAAVREFNRFYTSRIGVLDEGYLSSRFSLTEVRVLYELAHRGSATASELGRDLGIDAGYLSRILRGFSRRGVVARAAAKDDARKSILRLTARGRATVAPLEAKAREQIGVMLDSVPPTEQARLVASMRAIERGLRPRDCAAPKVTLRTHRPGDMGWVVERHGSLYWEEYGWDETFEALVADIVAKFVTHVDPKRERCWIAEVDGERVGCVFCVKKTKTVAKLRLLLVDPRARGLGVGTRLVDECIRFARAAGYRDLVLWTNDVLVAARRIYERAGFQLVESERHRSFSKALVGQNWTLRL